MVPIYVKRDLINSQNFLTFIDLPGILFFELGDSFNLLIKILFFLQWIQNFN